MYGWKWSSNDFLCRPHHSLEGLLLCGGAAAIPYWEAAGQDVLYGASVETCGDLRENYFIANVRAHICYRERERGGLGSKKEERERKEAERRREKRIEKRGRECVRE